MDAREIIPEELPTDYRLWASQDSLTWRTYLAGGAGVVVMGSICGFLASLALWILLLPLWFLTGWGVGPGEVNGEWLADNWPWLLIWFSFANAVAGMWHGVRSYDQALRSELYARQRKWHRRNESSKNDAN